MWSSRDMTSRIDRIRMVLSASPGTTAAEHMEYLDGPSGKHDDLMVTSRALYSMLGAADAEAMLSALQAVAAGNPVVARVLAWMDPPADGINLGDPVTRANLGALVPPLTQQQVDAVLGLARELTRREASGLGRVYVREIRDAMGVQ